MGNKDYLKQVSRLQGESGSHREKEERKHYYNLQAYESSGDTVDIDEFEHTETD